MNDGASTSPCCYHDLLDSFYAKFPTMTDTSLQRERLEKPTLIYPFETPPEVGQVLEIVPSVVSMRMPLPMALNHINVWGLEDEGGWAVVDTGMRTDETLATWRTLFAVTTEQRPLTRVFVTHMHPDHIGMAGWLTRKFSCRLWPGWHAAIERNLGGIRGCTHLRELLFNMATAAYQTVVSYREHLSVLDTGSTLTAIMPPFHLGKCMPWDFNGAVVKRYEPDFFGWQPLKRMENPE